MKSTNFLKAKRVGDQGEKLVADWMQRLGYNVEDVSMNRDYFDKDIDFLMSKDGEEMTVEVKTDQRMADSGNVLLEIRVDVDKNKDGWWKYCQATHLFFVDIRQKQVHCVRREELKQLVNSKPNGIVQRYLRVRDNGKVRDGEVLLVPISLLRTLPHYVLLNRDIINKIGGKQNA